MPPKIVGETAAARRKVAAQTAGERIAASEALPDPREEMVLAMGHDPSDPMPEEVRAEVAGLFGAGDRAGRKEALVRGALIRLCGEQARSEPFRLKVLASRTGFAAQAAQFLASKWEAELRPKTWVDRLSRDEQEEWARLKRVYSAAISRSNENVAHARAAYQKALNDERLAQETERQVLFTWLTEKGVDLSEVVPSTPTATEQLARELDALGITHALREGTSGDPAGGAEP